MKNAIRKYFIFVIFFLILFSFLRVLLKDYSNEIEQMILVFIGFATGLIVASGFGTEKSSSINKKQ